MAIITGYIVVAGRYDSDEDGNLEANDKFISEVYPTLREAKNVARVNGDGYDYHNIEAQFD